MFYKSLGAVYTRKFNLGNFESVEISAQVYTQLDAGDDEEQCMDDMFAVCKNSVIANIPPSYSRANPNVTTKFKRPNMDITEEVGVFENHEI